VLRAGELEAVSKAIAILHGDDARDLFKKSLESQNFLQVSSAVSVWRVSAAVKALRYAGLAKMATRVEGAARTNHFKQVIKSIDKMISDLGVEEEADLALKEQCEQDNAENKRTAIVHSRMIDEASDTIARLTREVEDVEAEMRIRRRRLQHRRQYRHQIRRLTRLQILPQNQRQVQRSRLQSRRR
jgi:hypothetical protein